jgi:hypothetical protein
MTFYAEVSDWAAQYHTAAAAILRQAAQETVNIAQRPRSEGGRMRVDTGFLRASLMASTSAMPRINPSARPTEGGTYQVADISAALLNFQMGETLYIGYTASYAAYREYGTRGQPPDAFVRLAAQRWPATVKRVERMLMNG